MRQITPTGWGKSGGVPVKQYGSLRAVIAKLPAGSVVIVDHMERSRRVDEILAELQRPRSDIRTLTAAAGPSMLYAISRQTPIGIDGDAFAGIPSAMWADMQQILTTRFETVLWV